MISSSGLAAVLLFLFVLVPPGLALTAANCRACRNQRGARLGRGPTRTS